MYKRQEEWESQSKSEKADIKARQGVRYPNTEEVCVADPETYEKVPMDGETMGDFNSR